MPVLVEAVVRAILLAVGWIALAGWEADYALYGVISVGAATALSLALLPPGRVRVAASLRPRRAAAVLRLIGWFLGQAFVGGADVARRAVRRRPDIDPAVVPAPFTLPPGPGRETAMLLMNLMPGTMVQRIITADGRETADAGRTAAGVELHTLSEELAPARQWSQLQRRVAAAFGVPVPEEEGRSG